MKSLSYTFDKNIILSIGMIVKNEEKMLSRCLECLTPLLDAVPSELVIVDTGSTDRTVEVAKQYTSKVFHFDWVNDFSAARNFGLKKCRGMWFMFLDADDHFQDVSDMIEFFNNEKLHKDYNNAFYITRNFTDTNYNNYYNLYAHRIARRTDDLSFEGTIHEYFTGFYDPAYYFNSYAYHYGYAFENEEQKKKKAERNLVLLEKELEKKPDDLRTISHVIGAMLDMNEKKRALTERAVVLSENSDDAYSYSAYFNAFEMYTASGETEKAFAALDKVLAKAKPDNAVLTEAYGCKAWLYHSLKKYAEAEENIIKYLAELDKYERGELDKNVFTFLVANYTMPEKRVDFLNMLALCISAQSRAEEAFTAYESLSLTEITPADFIKITDTILILAKNKAAHASLAAFYARVLEAGNEAQTALFEQTLEKIYFADRGFAESFAKNKTSGKFTQLMQACAIEDKSALEAFIDGFGETPLPEGFSAAIELALSHNIKLDSALSKMNLELIKTHLTLVASKNHQLPVWAIKYQSNEFFFANIKNLLFGTLLFEAACLRADSLNAVQRFEVYNRCIEYCSLYVSNAYNPDLLNADDISALPESHRFGYFMDSAKNLLDSGDKLGYIKELKKALASCNSMQSIIKYKIEEFSRTL
ncbi:MAG: glycosyltransferase [Oscillospiraceae bacterium]|nr:glycosyltransferase [Oscillospiraceae bacterium]